MSEGMQITIPDFDEGNAGLTTPFGRGGGFGFGGGFGGGMESPTVSTPMGGFGERSLFSHSRGDSSASVDSANSATTKRYTTRPSIPFGHSTQPSVSTTSSSFSKKPSFASIRNAFKSSGKNSHNDLPPVPQLDTSYPVLKNPFNRSTSSLHHVPPLTSRVNTSSPFARPPTPGSAETRFGRSRSKSHAHAKSHGSIFHSSDMGSDLGHQFTSSPPPMPPFPSAFGQFGRSDTPPTDIEEEKVVMDPKTPSDFALHAIFIRFVTLAERKIDSFLRQPLSQNPLLQDSMGDGVDPNFDETLRSLGQIAQKHTKAVIDSIMRWRRSQNEPANMEIVRLHSTQSPGSRGRTQDVPSIINERKSMASIYIMCRALIAVLSSIPKDALGETMGYNLEETTFEQFRRPDLRLLLQSVNHRTNADLYATLLGHLANIRFMSVTDRFLAELGPITHGQVSKEDAKYENLVNGLRHIKIKVWPYEAFEEGAEFMEPLAKAFGNAHGLRLKSSFAETLVHLLHPISKTAQAETNNPQWAKAIEIIYPKAREMVSKPRYWQVAYPLTITSLCVAPQAVFLKHWVSCFEISLTRLKEKQTRILAMNGLLRLLWTYLYRCQESPSTTTSRLDTLMKHFFHSSKLSSPADDRLDFLTYIVHFILSRHFDTGRDLCLELLQESSINSLQKGQNMSTTLIPERITIAVQASLLSLCLMEKDNISVPTWPSPHDFTIFPPKEDYPTSATVLPAPLAAKVVIQDYVNRVGTTLGHVAIFCDNAVGHLSVLDDQWSYSRLTSSYEESSDYVIRRHGPSLVVAYPAQLTAQINLLQTCFMAWPRFLHSSIPLGDAVEMLLRGVMHVEPSLSDIAVDAIKRIMDESTNITTVMRQFTSFLFDPVNILQSSGPKLLLEYSKMLDLWSVVVERWKVFMEQEVDKEDLVLRNEIEEQYSNIEAATLFLLAHGILGLRSTGVKVVRLLGSLSFVQDKPSEGTYLASYLPIIGRLINGPENSYLDGFDDLLEQPELDHLKQRKKEKKHDLLLDIASSSKDLDKKLWRYVFPSFMQSCMDTNPSSLRVYRDLLAAAALRFHPQISQLAGLSNAKSINRGGGGGISSSLTERDGLKMIRECKPLIDQWHIWMKIICSTAILPDSPLMSTPAHVGGDPLLEIRKYSNSRYLFKRLTPFLDSEYTLFRDVAVLCISSFPSNVYPQLLEDLKSLAGRQTDYDPRAKVNGGVVVMDGNIGLLGSRQFVEEARAKAGSGFGLANMDRSRRQERLHSAVARIYFLTAHLLQGQRSTGRQTSLMNILTFIRSTQGFLTTPEMRENHSLQRLRRYFCGTIEKVFDALAFIKDSDRFVAANMHLTLYRLCEEWCQLGVQSEGAVKRLKSMQRQAMAFANSNSDTGDLKDKFQAETTLLSHAAIGALASLCAKALFPPDDSAGSPNERVEHLERLSPDLSKPLTPAVVLDRLKAICACSHEPSQARGRKALKSILTSLALGPGAVAGIMSRAVIIPEEKDTSSRQFFEVVVDAVCSNDARAFSFSQVVCLGFANLRHIDPEIRRHAFYLLEAIHHQSQGLLTMSNFEAAAGSSAACAYIHAHRSVSDFLAGEHPDEAINMLKQVGEWLPSIPEKPSTTHIILLILQSLEFWLPHISLMTEDRTSFSKEGVQCLYYLMSLTLRYSQSHPEQILVMWTRLVEPPNHSNGHAAVRFLLEQSNKVGNTKFICCACNIVTGLCQTPVGRQIFEELCSVIEPARMLPTIDHQLTFPAEEEVDLWSDLNDLFSDEPRIVLGSAQYAWLFLSDVALQGSWESKAQLPILLHTLFTHIDHRHPFIRERAQIMLFQILRSWTPGYAELTDRSIARTRSSVKDAINQLAEEVHDHYWKEDDSPQICETKMEWLCSRVIKFLEPLHPQIASHWGSLALSWGTACSIRSIAFRSLQLFRALMPRIKKSDFALLLGRLTNTIASDDENIQSFTSELLQTIIAIAKTGDIDRSLMPQLFWCTCACLSTTVEKEFLQSLELLDAVLKRIDLDDPATTDFLLSQRPMDWEGQTFIQQLLLKGLRSSVSSGATMKTLQKLARVGEDGLVDASGGRVRDLYTVSLPWCLHAMATDKKDPALLEFAENISHLAAKEGRKSISKIMNSFSKGHFRTKDDFLRQSISSLREHYGSQNWTEIITLLLGLVLNSNKWLCIQSMQIVKILFQQRETWNPVELLGSVLLMPLLRLLETDLASHALEVLEEPMVMSGGPPAKHVLRMSMHGRLSQRLPNTVTTVFGVPEESGWCIAQIDSQRNACRANVMAVFDTCSMATRPSQIIFEPELEAIHASSSSSAPRSDLGGLVKNLHDLTSYFRENGASNRSGTPTLPSRKVEARVAAILAKSTAVEAISDIPQTPFLDVFQVRRDGPSTESDNDSDTDSDEDAFIFDSPALYQRSRLNSSHSRF